MGNPKMKTLPDKIALNLDNNTEVSVTGFIAPIEDMDPNFHEEWEALANLQVAEPEKGYSTSVFQAFLPNEPVSVGDSWQIDDEGALAVLKQFQPNPNLDMHINAGDSRGLWACLRAYNAEFADIVFRIHAAFALTDGWFTPSQFSGHLVIDRPKKCVVFFQMCVPEDTWFDVNWKKHKDDLGFSTGGGVCPRIELRTGTQIPNPEYTESITQEAAEHELIRCFYKSQRINWVSLEEALEMAEKMQKPIHAISIDGPLANEAC